jgi:glycosyltransferase involved in cell wall biosynthesis
VRIGLVTTHAWPLPSPARVGDIWALDLAIALDAMGHQVTMFSPEGTAFKNVKPMRCAYGKGSPGIVECESECLRVHEADLLSQDIVHDTSAGKLVGLMLARRGRPVCMTLTGGPWREQIPPAQLIVQTESQRERVLRGVTDYEGTKSPDLGGPNGFAVKEAHVVNDGIDTDFYCPANYDKDDYVLWLNRWHPTKGCALAIAWAKATGTRLMVAGEHPENETSEYQRSYALEMRDMSKDAPSVLFLALPGDPGHHEAKRELYRRAKALIYTTQFQEPFGLSMVEAMACGTPVIATRYGSTPEVLEHGLTGFLVNDDAGIFNGLSAGCVWAGQSALPLNCRTIAVERFSREVMARNYLAEYQNIIDGACW